MNDRVFVDTNVLIYAHDTRAGRKHAIARDTVAGLWASRTGALSTQVLQEFYVNVTRKIPSPLTRSVARELVGAYGVWHVENVGLAHVLRASELEERHRLSFWDALILAAAQAAGASRILSEDLSDGHRIAGVAIDNPFRRRPT